MTPDWLILRDTRKEALTISMDGPAETPPRSIAVAQVAKDGVVRVHHYELVQQRDPDPAELGWIDRLMLSMKR